VNANSLFAQIGYGKKIRIIIRWVLVPSTLISQILSLMDRVAGRPSFFMPGCTSVAIRCNPGAKGVPKLMNLAGFNRFGSRAYQEFIG
jgi:hypothetical protein